MSSTFRCLFIVFCFHHIISFNFVVSPLKYGYSKKSTTVSDPLPTSSPFVRQSVKNFTKLIATSIASFSIGSNLPLAPSQWTTPIPAAHAVVANLADVGVKEFLVKDGKQFLRLTIPFGEKGLRFDVASKSAKAMQSAQESLELVKLRFEQVGFTNPTAWGPTLKDANSALALIKAEQPYLISGSKVNDNGAEVSAEGFFENKLIPSINNLIDALRTKDIEKALQYQDESAEFLAQLRLAQLPPHSLPFDIPAEYSKLPTLKGRAKIRMQIHFEGNKGKGFLLSDGKSYSRDIDVISIADGYHAPVTAGNFVDLVNKGFYNNMPLQKIEELTIQTGKLKVGNGYVDPRTGETRYIPLELFYKRDSAPTYDITSDDDLRATETMALPFQAYGALGMARENEFGTSSTTDTASSEFFILKWMQALIPPGRNTLDGSYACFGYVTKNENLLSQITMPQSATIVTAEVVEGRENLYKSD